MLLIHATEDTVSPRRLLKPLTASPLVTLREFDCKHLQAAFTHTEEYFTALDFPTFRRWDDVVTCTQLFC